MSHQAHRAGKRMTGSGGNISHWVSRKPVQQTWYIVRDGKDLRIMRDPGEWKVVRVVHGKMAAAQRELKRLQK